MHMKSYLVARDAMLTRYGPSLDKDDRLVHAMIRIDDRMTTIQHWISHSRLNAEATANFNANLPYPVHEHRSVVGH